MWTKFKANGRVGESGYNVYNKSQILTEIETITKNEGGNKQNSKKNEKKESK